MSDLRILNAAEVKASLPMAEAIEGMKEAYSQLSGGQVTLPLRSHIEVPSHKGITLVMPAYLPRKDDLAVKIVSVFPENVRRQEPVINAVVVVMDASTGRPTALLDGSTVTAIRTGAASGAATDILARPDAKVAAIFGSGVQARTQLEAICTVRQIQEVRVFSLDFAQAQQFAQDMRQLDITPDDIQAVDSPAAAIRGADIVCTATTSTVPVFDGKDLALGSHINAIGSFTPNMQEIDVTTIHRSRVFVDSREAAMEEAGDILKPLAAGELSENPIYAELGEVINGQKPGRLDPTQITFFKSVGIAVQDAVAGRITLKNASVNDLGLIISLS